MSTIVRSAYSTYTAYYTLCMYVAYYTPHPYAIRSGSRQQTAQQPARRNVRLYETLLREGHHRADDLVLLRSLISEIPGGLRRQVLRC